MAKLRMIDCARENERAEILATIDANIAKREAEPWDWADYQALAALAEYEVIQSDEPNPVAWALEACGHDLEDEATRAALARRFREIADNERNETNRDIHRLRKNVFDLECALRMLQNRMRFGSVL